MTSLPSAPAKQPLGFDLHAFIREFSERLEDTTRQLPLTDTARGVVSLTLSTPDLSEANVGGLTANELYWARPDQSRLRIGLGKALQFAGSGSDRFIILNKQFKDISNNWYHFDPDRCNPEPGLFVGWAFDSGAGAGDLWEGAENAMLKLPELLYTRRRSTAFITFSIDPAQRLPRQRIVARWSELTRRLVTRLQAPTRPTRLNALGMIDEKEAPQYWSRRVATALDAIARGELDKVVLSRRVSFQARRPIQVGGMLAWLQNRYSECCHFSVPLGEKLLVGISPERLIRLDQGRVSVDAIAGSGPVVGESNSQQARPAVLEDDPKARLEQELVVEAVVSALAPVSDRLMAGDTPTTLSLPNVQHLRTRIEARVRSGMNLLELAARLHPTPAVGGTPRDKALAWLATQDECWRGWYTGALGWITAEGNGELVVVLRCALLAGKAATLFAGAGIVHGSDPKQEYLETQWKLRTMLDALRHSG